MAWYKRENFIKLRAMFDDGDTLHGTYDEWLAAANEGFNRFASRKDVRVFKIDIDPVEFPRWCAAKGLRMNSKARTEYCNFMVYQMVRNQGAPS